MNQLISTKTIQELKSRLNIVFLFIFAVTLGWKLSYIYFKLVSTPVEFKNDKAVSISIDERGRLHILDLEQLKTVIYSDTITMAIHSKISSELYKDYITKSTETNK